LAKNLRLRFGLERERVQLFDDARRLEEWVVAAKERAILEASADLTGQLFGVIARRPARELDKDIRLVQRHRDQLEVPGPAKVRRDNRQVRKSRRDGVQMDRAGRVELDALASRLAGTDAARPRVKQAGQLQLRGLLPELEMPFIARVEVLHRWVELGPFGAELFDGTLQLRDGVRLPRIDRGEECETLRVPFDDRANKIVCERRPVGRGLGVPGEQNSKDLFLGEFDGELVDTALVDLGTEIARCALPVRTHAAIKPFAQRQMDMQVDRANQVRRPVVLLLRQK